MAIAQGYHQWTRYWQPWDGRMGTPATDFLPELDSDYELRRHPDLAPLAAISGVRCLVLLGEPGIGKTTAVEDEIARLKSHGERVAYHDLKAYDTADRLEKKIFDSSEFLETEKGAPLTLVLDSIDEGRIVLENVTQVLKNELQRRFAADPGLPSRLKLRITCRSQEWPPSFGVDLAQLYLGDDYAIWHLCQLRRSDVKTAAANLGLNGVTVLDEIEKIGATALAVKPVTLRLLLELKKQTGELPTRQVELYRKGLLELCKDPNAWRNEESKAGALSPKQRMVIARRIAGLSILCQRPFIRRNDSPGLDDESTLSLDDICEATAKEPLEAEQFSFSRDAIQETLKCGLFRGSDEHRVAWAHLTYAEFLAADYLHAHEIQGEQLQNILQAPGESEDRIAPQLADVSAWLCSLDESIAARLLSQNPDILLRSDVTVGDASAKVAVTERYLSAIARHELRDEPNEEYYGRLACKELAVALAPYVSGAASDLKARYAALRITEACKIEGCLPELVELALDVEQPKSLRQLSLSAIEQIDNSAAIARLKPLLTSDDDEILADVIGLLWPRVISTTEMLPYLRPLSDPDLIGTYRLLIEHDLLGKISDDDVAETIIWMAGFIAEHPKKSPPADDEVRSVEPFAAMVGPLYARGIGLISNPSTFEALIKLARAVVKSRDWLFARNGREVLFQTVPDDDALRRSLALGMLTASASYVHAWQIPYFDFGLLKTPDLNWIIGQSLSHPNREVRNHLADIAMRLYDRSDPVQFETIYDAHLAIPEFKRFTDDIIGYVLLDSDAAKQAKRYYQAEQKRKATPAPTHPTAPTAAEVIATANERLNDAESRPEIWWKVFYRMNFIEDHGFGMSYNDSLDSISGWKLLDEKTKVRITTTAPKFLAIGDPAIDTWWTDEQKGDWRAEAGFRALSCLLERDHAALIALPASVWKKWTPVIIRRGRDGGKDGSAVRLLAKHSHEIVPETFVKWLARRISLLAKSKDHRVYFGGILQGEWSDEIAKLVVECMSLPALHYESLHEALWLLLDRSPDRGFSFIDAAVRGRLLKHRQAVAFWTALRHDDGMLWTHYWPVVTKDPSFGVDVLKLTMGDDFFGTMSHLTPDNYADLYLFLHAHLRVPENSSGGRRRARTDPHELSYQKDRILPYLSNLQSQDAVDALKRIMNFSPDLSWVSYYVVLCADNLRRSMWQAPTPQALRKLAADKDRRLVRSGSELLDVLSQALRRFEQELHAKQGILGSLWNTQQNNFRPKSENEASDVIIQFLRADLKQRGIITNREVELRQSMGGAGGERTDIHVDAVLDSSGDVVTAIIEVKGCWNADLQTALSNQLADRYLNKSGVLHGIYLVGWYLCPAWTMADKRRATADALGWNLGVAQGELSALARAQSKGGRDVRAVVLDAMWPTKKPRKKAATKSRSKMAKVSSRKPKKQKVRAKSGAAGKRKPKARKLIPLRTRA